MAQDHAWNDFSPNYTYILSEIKDNAADNFGELTKLRKRENDQKVPKSLHQITSDLWDLYSGIYDLNFQVYKARKNETTIEIRYFPTSSLDSAFLEKVKDNEPMLHCKVPIPPYADVKTKKFDINWEQGGIRHEWNMFWWRRKTKRDL